ncbi:hypothetical protein NVV76_00980 [Pediococcus ethanolidurans]|uniref:hypothetical protein n=1 Tax=Pediococcus ethanolidurans TaxID=319653 RepID=UPI0021E9735E|nr:hypothetical protein [Pediococcus ethanolidurans]MCV3326745.1 hypothetical protein [Pediococcus ethanolidurans]
MRTNKNDVEDLSIELEKAYQLNLVLADYLQQISNAKVVGDDEGVFYLSLQNIERMVTVQDLIQDSLQAMQEQCNESLEVDEHERF